MPSIPRRAFLQAGALSGFAFVACDRAPDAPATGAVPLPPAERADLEAIAARILPSDDGTTGATEAGVIVFIERMLTTVYIDRRPLIDEGLADLTRRAGGSFAALPADRQDTLLREIEKTPFFDALRYLTICGMFGDPSWGGNRERAGWKLLGFDPRAIWQPPFGAYDAVIGEGE